MGSVYNKNRLPTRVSFETPKFGNKTQYCCCQKRKYFGKRNKYTFTKRCNRTCTCRRLRNRFLQYIFPCNKKEWTNETHFKLETPKQVSCQETFQDGHYDQSYKFDETKRLGYIPRPSGRIPSHPNFQRTQKISKVLCSREMLPMEMSVFRPNFGPTSFYQNYVSSSCVSTSSKHKTGYLSGRLVSTKPDTVTTSKRPTDNNESFNVARFHHKQRKVQFDPNAINNVHRGTFSSEPRLSQTDTRQNNKATVGNRENSKRSKQSIRFSPLTWDNGIMHRINPICPLVYASNPVTPVKFLETINSSVRGQNTNFTTSNCTSGLVEKYSKHFQGQIFSTAHNECNHNDRCITDGIRGLHGKSVYAGDLVRKTKESAHKRFGVGSGVSNCKTFSKRIDRTDCVDQMRQHNSSSICEQTGGYTVSSTMLQNLGPMELSNREQNSVESSSYCRQEKRSGGSVEQEQNSTNRMDFMQCSSPENISNLGFPTDRSVCVDKEPSNSDILLLDTSSTGLCPRLTDNIVGEHVGVCLSPNMSDSESFEAHDSIQLPNHSHSPTMAQETLVYRPVTASSSVPNETSKSVESITSTEFTDKSSRCESFQSDCMVAIDQQFKKKGFSKQTRKLLTASWRKGTQKDYASKFKKFNSWCSSREVDPYCATLTQVTDFLTHLYTSGLQYRTIAGYRSMLSSV